MNEKRSPPVFDFLTYVLLTLMLCMSTWSLVTADWADHLSLITTIAGLGIFAGAALARSLFSTRVASLFASVYGVFIVGWQIALTLDPGLIWRDKIYALLDRLVVYFKVITTHQPNRDPLMFVLLMAILYWTFSVLAAWALFRRGEVWMAVIPSGIAVVVNTYLYRGEYSLSVFLAAYWFLALVLIMRSDIKHRQKVWHALQATVPTEAEFLLNRSGVITAVVLIAVAWLSPAFSKYNSLADFWNSITTPFQEVEDWFGDTLGALRGPVTLIPEYYGDVLNLEAGIERENIPVLEADPRKLPNNGGRFYWRSRVYDRYEDGNWSSTLIHLMPFDPEIGELKLPTYAGREKIEVELRPVDNPISRLYLPAQPLWVNRSTEITVALSEDALVDVANMTAAQYVMRGESYRVIASVATPSGVQLRYAGSEYPEWVVERYLQLPETITDRTFELAERITLGLESPYDKSVAITTWLRNNIEYRRDTDAPPFDAEPIDWFLFDYRIGYCNYYASAQIIMLRSLGIPARLAAGYARGSYDSTKGQYTVTADDAHAWPEVFFPGYGWVEFEPTVSQEELARPESIALGDPTGRGDIRQLELTEGVEREYEGESNADNVAPVRPLQPIDRRFLLLFVFLACIAAVFLLRLWKRVDPHSWELARRLVARGLNRMGVERSGEYQPVRIETSPIGKIYHNWNRFSQHIGARLHHAQTPHERATHFADLLPDSTTHVWTIVTAYTRERFGMEQVDVQDAQRAWRRLRPRMLLAWIRRIFTDLRNSPSSGPHYRREGK